MDFIVYIISILSYLMDICYSLVQDYTVAIILFTGLTKIVLLPIAIWTHKNSLRMVRLMPELNRIKVKYYGDGDRIAEEQQALYKREKYHALLSIVPMLIQIILLIALVRVINESLSGTSLIMIPIEVKGIPLLMPLAAGASAYILSIIQDRINPLQREQTRAGQISTMSVSVGISLFLGAFVPVGVGLYWVFSNLFTIVQQFLLNSIIPPEKYVDYEELKKSKKELEDINSIGSDHKKKWHERDIYKKRERADYKRFFSIANKHLVFYSEKSGFYKYFESVIEELLKRSNIVIHYVTSDPNDQVFELAKIQPRIKPYYIGEKRLITLMMKMDADMVVMTMPDLENYHIKRSYVRKDVEYVYMFHGVASVHMVLRKGALDHFDTLFCVGPHQIDEIRAIEKVYGLPEKKLIPCGYGVIEKQREAYERIEVDPDRTKQIMIAPSWQKDNIMELCLDEILQTLLSLPYQIILRPHPQYLRYRAAQLDQIKHDYKEYLGQKLIIQDDFSDSISVFTSDILITDWSTIAHEFCYATLKPAIFINTPMKVMNPEYERIPFVPLDISLRNEIGVSIDIERLNELSGVIQDMLLRQSDYQKKISDIVQRYVFNFGHSGEVGAKYIIKSIVDKKKI